VLGFQQKKENFCIFATQPALRSDFLLRAGFLTEGEEVWVCWFAPGTNLPPAKFKVVVGEEGFGAGWRGAP